MSDSRTIYCHDHPARKNRCEGLDRFYGGTPSARRLTVSRHYPERRAARSLDLPITPMQFLRLQGRWLDQAGFAIGANVRVEVAAGRLVLEVIDAEESQRR